MAVRETIIIAITVSIGLFVAVILIDKADMKNADCFKQLSQKLEAASDLNKQLVAAMLINNRSCSVLKETQDML
jgi:hypothetical protein